MYPIHTHTQHCRAASVWLGDKSETRLKQHLYACVVGTQNPSQCWGQTQYTRVHLTACRRAYLAACRREHLTAGGCTLLPAGGCTLLPGGGCTLLPAEGRTLLPAGGCTLLPAEGRTLLPAGGCTLLPTRGRTSLPAGGRTSLPAGWWIDQGVYQQLHSLHTSTDLLVTTNTVGVTGMEITGY